MPINNQITFRKGSSSLWTSTNPVLASGEPGYETDTGRIKIGNGSNWNVTNYAAVVPSGFLAGNGISIGSGTNGSTITITSTGSGLLSDQAKSLVTTVFNNTGSPIPKMSAVYINGGQGDTATIQKAIATGDLTSAGTYGLTYENIDNMSTGQVIVFGALTGVNTDQFNPTAPTGNINGTVLYLSPTTSGALTTSKPSAPNHIVAIGTVVRTHQNEGVIEVRVQNGFELEELHNVAISGATNGQFLQYNSASGLWLASSSGNFSTLQVNGTGVSVSGHSHTSSDITNFNTAVSGLLPTIANSGDNRVLTSTGSSVGVNAESNLTFNGSSLVVAGDATVDNLKLDGNILSSTSGNIIISPSGNGALQRDSGGNARGQYAVDWQGVRSTGTMVAGGSYSTVGGGINNTSSGAYSTVGGGYYNTSSGNSSTVGGGFNNTSSGSASTVGGGSTNTSSDTYSMVGGGKYNTSSGPASTVGGGFNNTSSGSYSIVGGGRGNTSSGYYSTVGGGYLNASSGGHSTVGGGRANNSIGGYGTVGGGYLNTSSGGYGTVGGGRGNTSSSYSSTVGGGKYNTSSGYFSTVGGGSTNTSSATYSTVGGGKYNTSSGYYSTVGGGNTNTSSGGRSTVGGGRDNISSGDYGTVGGGNTNTSSGYYSTVGGGFVNTSSGTNSTVGGGFVNTSSGGYSTVPGGLRGKATRYGELAHSAGRFSQDGDAQHSILISRRSTTNATANVVLTLNGDTPSSTNRLTLPSQTAWSFGIKVSAYNSTDNEGAWWIIRGGIRRDNSNNTALVGSLITESGTESSLSSASVSVVADDTNEALEIRVTGVSGKTIRWVAVVDISQVSFGTP